MGRSVVTKASPRCPGCAQIPRWCICCDLAIPQSDLNLAVLIHHAEFYKPTSTGRLIHRLLPASDLIVFKHDLPFSKEKLTDGGKETLVLHPFGEPLDPRTNLGQSRFVLLDGNWRQAATMLQSIEGIGRKVCLPIEGPSRFWLREKQEGSRFSTMEAFIFLLKHLGQEAMASQCQIAFELHVYAGLLARGKRDLARAYYLDMPKNDLICEVVKRLGINLT